MRQVLSTEAIGEDDRLDSWNQVASVVFWPLRVADVASACHVSLRQLYRVFERAGQTVAGAIRERRLARARAVLETM